MTAMTVSPLSVTPVKGLAMHHPDHVDLAEGGVAGDREFFLVDASGRDGELHRHRRADGPPRGPGRSHRRTHRPWAGRDRALRARGARRRRSTPTSTACARSPVASVLGWDDVFSDIAGQPVRLVRGDTGAFDVAGVTLVGASSTAGLAATNALESVDARRFRMNVEIAGGDPLVEDSWDGRELRLGDAVVRVGRPGEALRRDHPQPRHRRDRPADPQAHRRAQGPPGVRPTWGAGFYFGVYADVLTPGRVAVGDEVTLL